MQHLADPKFVPKVYGPHPHAPYRANTKQISDFLSFRYLAGGWCLSFRCTKPWKGAPVSFFVWQFSIETFMFNASSSNLTHQPAEAPFTSQRSQDLMKLLPIWGSFSFRPSYQIQVSSDSSSSLFHFRCSSSHPVPNGIAKSVFLLTGTINQARFNKSMLSQATKSPCSKDCAVDLKDGCKLREQSLSIVLAQNLEKAHLPKTMKSPSFPVQSREFTLSNKNQSVFVLHRDFPWSMPALQNLSHQPEALFTSQGSQEVVKLLPHWGSFTFRPRYQA